MLHQGKKRFNLQIAIQNGSQLPNNGSFNSAPDFVSCLESNQHSEEPNMEIFNTCIESAKFEKVCWGLRPDCPAGRGPPRRRGSSAGGARRAASAWQ